MRRRPALRTRTVAAAMAVALAVVAGVVSVHSHRDHGHPGSGTSGSPRPAGTRDPLVQPFDSASIWNQPIGSAARYVPANLAPPTVRALTADQTVVLMDSSAPATAIVRNGGQHSDRCAATGTTLATVPIPAGLVVPSGKANHGYAILEADGSTVVEGGAFARCAPGTIATATSARAIGSITGDGLQGGAGGSRLSTLGGVLRINELVPGGSIRHAIRVNVDGELDLFPGTAATCFRWPATRCDGYGPRRYGGHNPALTMGALLALPGSLNLADIGLRSAPGAILARALQDYGAYVSNDTARPLFSIDTEIGDASTVEQFDRAWGFTFDTPGVSGTPWTDDVLRILAKLDVVDNNGPASIGGGGRPRAAPAAPVALAQPMTGSTAAQLHRPVFPPRAQWADESAPSRRPDGMLGVRSV